MIRFLNRHPIGCLFILAQFAIYGLGTTVLWYTVGTLSEREKGTRNGNGERQDQEDSRYD